MLLEITFMLDGKHHKSIKAFIGVNFRNECGKIKEFKAKNEEELLDLVMLWPKFDEEWHKGGEWIEPTEKAQSTAKQKTVTKRKYRAL